MVGLLYGVISEMMPADFTKLFLSVHVGRCYWTVILPVVRARIESRVVRGEVTQSHASSRLSPSRFDVHNIYCSIQEPSLDFYFPSLLLIVLHVVETNMLALVHPFNPTSDVPHRTPSSSSRSRQPHRKPMVSTASTLSLPNSSSSSSSRQASAIPAPSLQRYTSHPQPPILQLPRHKPRQPSPPPRVVRVPTPPLAQAEPSLSHTPQFNIHTYPSSDLLRLLASLLSQIAATNDKLDAASAMPPTESSAHMPSSPQEQIHHGAIWDTLATASRVALSTPTSTLTFHARNIPTISLEAYLLRILKYCPTTNEVFLSLLVYFDRMSKLTAEATGRTFVIDSFNIHRLVIAGVTVASKFFSDVFYTNSRYAKVRLLCSTSLGCPNLTSLSSSYP